jgi:hypothetical protein
MNRSARASLVVLPLLAALAACGGSSSANPAPRRSARLLTYFEIQEGLQQNKMNMYDLIASRKSNWLRPTMSRAPATTSSTGAGNPVSVWLDGVRLGGAEQLRTIPLTMVMEARYLTPSEAQAALGLNNLGGAIVVVSRRE